MERIPDRLELLELLEREPFGSLLETASSHPYAAVGNRELVFCASLAELRELRLRGSIAEHGAYVFLPDMVRPIGVAHLEPLEPASSSSEPARLTVNWLTGDVKRDGVSIDPRTGAPLEPASSSSELEELRQATAAAELERLRAMPPAPLGPLGELELETLEALWAWVVAYGKRWRDELLTAWVRASAPGPLHALRNRKGPAWLATVSDEHIRALAEWLEESKVSTLEPELEELELEPDSAELELASRGDVPVLAMRCRDEWFHVADDLEEAARELEEGSSYVSHGQCESCGSPELTVRWRPGASVPLLVCEGAPDAAREAELDRCDAGAVEALRTGCGARYGVSWQASREVTF